MKKLLILPMIAIALFLTNCKKDEDKKKEEPVEFLASTEPENRKVVLEDFTGVRCGYCVDGHVKAKAMVEANPGKVFIVAVHSSGSYSKPVAGWANLENPLGLEINKQAFPLGFPAGSINRMKFESHLQQVTQNGKTYTSKLAMGRTSWAIVAPEVLAMSSPVNLGSKATYDATTRELTVKVDVYYTAAETVDNNLNVFLLQDGIITKQSSGGDNYDQKHVLRASLTGTWGEKITEEKIAGAKITKTYTYTLPEDYNGATIPPGGGAVVLENLKIISFMSRGQLEILNATETSIEK